MLGATALGAFCAGAVSRRRNNTSWTLLVAHCLQLLGAGLMLMLRDVTMEIKAQYIFQVFLGLGIGLSLGAATISKLLLGPFPSCFGLHRDHSCLMKR